MKNYVKSSQEETTIIIPGLAKDLRIMQITDTHLCEVYQQEGEELRRIAGERHSGFRGQGQPGDFTLTDLLHEHIRLSNENKVDGVVFTGDIIDFPSVKNLDVMRSAFGDIQMPYLYMLGNHDWSFPHLPINDKVRTDSYRLFHEWFSNIYGCNALQVGGVILIAIDNSNYQLSEEQFAFIRKQCGLGLPCLLFMHIPLYLPSLEPQVRANWGSAIMMGAKDWTEQELANWQVRHPDESTLQFTEWIRSGKDSEQIKGVFCGHIHFNHVDPITPGRMQHTTLAGYLGGSRIIHLKKT
ncbi:hypothetical protein Back11_08960 [Paenibacillus baekrokdamisoli]|uniref:Uncharacterized protein n=1 Tax=Paenibacillus baekrokdamisoli TaxID=1712516 RepID=A0A3G9J115_9BACL|nr:metallophosphoesterase [Paenibacillus baekrokdamisoli]MBB3067260.1 UDP-2,3-diacylglucosamine pyrophosphatase LpxH [Paenibacillus baekrokdamisoli]BBH19551.1 hypothetical protein Back11_08960 [Paenibacillus baekrokdamisoli]